MAADTLICLPMPLSLPKTELQAMFLIFVGLLAVEVMAIPFRCQFSHFFVPCGVVIRKDTDRIIMENRGYIRTGKDQI